MNGATQGNDFEGNLTIPVVIMARPLTHLGMGSAFTPMATHALKQKGR